MKILLLTPYFAPHQGGSEIFLENLARRLFQIDEKWTTDVLTYNTEKVAAQEKFIDEKSGKRIGTIYRLQSLEPLRSQLALPNYFQLLGLWKKWQDDGNKYDLVISNTRFFDNSQWAPKLAKKMGAKVVLVDFCADHPNHKNRLITEIAGYTDTILTKKLKNKYDLIIATSEATKKFLQKMQLPAAKTVIYNGVEEAFFAQNKIEKTNQPIQITFAGRLIKNKHPEVFLAAAETVLEKFPQCKFNLVGEGPMAKELKEKWKDLPREKQKQIKIWGGLERSQLAKLLWQTTILVHPSTHSEGLPTILPEAGFCEAVIVASKAGDSEQIVQNEKTGTILKEPTRAQELARTLEKYLTEPELIEKQSQAISKLVKDKFTLTQQVEKFKGMAKELTEQNE